jgi:hypothetical protein
MAYSTKFNTLTHNEMGRVSFPAVFRAEAVEGGEPKFSVTLLFPKKSPAIAKLMAQYNEVVANAYAGNPPANLTKPFKDGDVKAAQDPKYSMYAGCYAVTFSSKFQPKVFGMDAKEITVMNQAEFYPGCWAVVHFNAYSWEFKSVKKGISFGFDAVQKVKDDESFGGGGVRSAEEAGFVAAASSDPSAYAGGVQTGCTAVPTDGMTDPLLG